MTFKTTLDRTVNIITIGLAFIFITLTIGQFSFLKSYMIAGAGPLLATIIVIMIFRRGYFSRVRSYKVTDNDIIVQRSFSKIVIPLKAVEIAEIINRDKLKGAHRINGNGGFFGYYGQFENKLLGEMTWYITQKNNLVLIKTIDGQKIVLSPNHPQQLIDSLNK